MLERRNEQRWPAYLAGMLMFDVDGQRSSVGCLIRNTSTSGARLVLDDAVDLPHEFLLQIPYWRAERRVHVRWRRLAQIGVETVPEEKAAAADLAMMRQIKRLESLKNELARSEAELGETAT